MEINRWHSLMTAWGVSEHDDVYFELLSAYAEPHRCYHTARHIDDCLVQFDEAISSTNAPEEVELALWFHDAVYQPTSSENEMKSAAWARRFLRSVGTADDRADRICSYVLATRHAENGLAGDAALVVDIDLSILGRTSEEFKVYEHAVRAEYEWVPIALYCRKRIEVLRSFLDRSSIYATKRFCDRYETQARENIRQAIRDLSA